MLRTLLVLILVSVAGIVLETDDAIVQRWQTVLDVLDVVVLALFTLEYVAHVIVAPKKREYIFSVWGLIDLMAILPSYLAFAHVGSIAFLRELRVLRVLRMLKLMKLAADRAGESSARAHEHKSSFGVDIQIYAICLLTVLVISGTLVWNVERGVKDTLFVSIPAAMWWAIVTVTTTGYGDMVPATVPGKIVAGLTMLAGLALFSLLTSVVGRVLMASLFGTPDESAPAVSERSGIDEIVEAIGGASIVGRQSKATEVLYSAFIDHSKPLYWWTRRVITLLIFGAVALVALETVEPIYTPNATLFAACEYVIVAVFTLEYAANVYLAEDRRGYILSFWGLIDLVAILPTYVGLLAMVITLNVTAIKIVRMLRVLRILRTLKLSKSAVDGAQKSLHRRGNTLFLDLQIYFIALFSALVILSTLVYFAEQDVENTPFNSIPASMWWGIVTITSTGYGDMVPTTFIGRLFGGVTMLTGLALFGILTSVVGRAMMSSLFGSAEAEDEQSGGASPHASPANVETESAESRVRRENARLMEENRRLREELNRLSLQPSTQP